jgi:4-alpha-glucanotransferase
MRLARSSGILCHPTCFPSRHGIGDLGQGAYDFVDWAAGAGQKLWQILPLGPTGYGDSPYQCFSAFAGNPNLISPDQLAWHGLLPAEALAEVPPFADGRVDYGPVIAHKARLLRRSFEHFQAHGTAEQRAGFAAFLEYHDGWVKDYALFMALKAHFGGGSWQDWPREVALRRPKALDPLRVELAAAITYYEYLQWCFADQWQALKSYANQKGIQIIGDIPIFAAEDSADVWGRPELFQLDKNHRPVVVAGVPPDYFSDAGQLWGNPHYCWDDMARDGYAWWVERIRRTLQMVDIVRVDHFRGFEAYWAVPAGDRTAKKGRWVKGPGATFFEAVEKALGKLPIIAEDLGIITPEVDELRLQFDLPGMKVLQFGFAQELDSKYLPHSYEANYVVYPGTHDNNTVAGWFNEPERTPQEKWKCLRYMNCDEVDLPWAFIRAAWGSVADVAVAQLQDVMGLGAEARMNYPSKLGGNWQWRYTPDRLTDALCARLRELTRLYQR